ncbi:DMT family transporter [Hominiventricola filiformis]|uniref:DMT family transporter n=1 Tax=Hominiventricola filiformis TaxID=2885352 RepID=A0AAE3DAA4_9FIRM|nr:DMT family transporter [Hominiventricola filiformis]MCC2126693.1 DMT family transporter [Hominiventricola filiformis]
MEKGKVLPLLILPVIWGSYYVASQKIIGYTSAFTAGVGIRFITMIFLTVIMYRRSELQKLTNTKGVLIRLLLIGTLGFLLDITAFIGLSLSSAASGTALLKCDVLMVNILSMIIYKQRFTWKAWACTGVMLLGVFMVMGIDFTTFRVSDPGNIFFLLSAFFVSCNAFVIKSVQLDKKNPVCDDVVAYYNNFVTLLYFLITSVIMRTLPQAAIVFTDRNAALALIFAALGQTLIYVVYYHNLRHYPVWLVKTFLLLMPIVSTIITFLVFHEKMVRLQYLGMGIVIVGALGILLEQNKEKKR